MTDQLTRASVDAAQHLLRARRHLAGALEWVAEVQAEVADCELDLDGALWDLYQHLRSAPAVSRAVSAGLVARGVEPADLVRSRLSHDHVRLVVGSRRDPLPRPEVAR